MISDHRCLRWFFCRDLLEYSKCTFTGRFRSLYRYFKTLFLEWKYQNKNVHKSPTIPEKLLFLSWIKNKLQQNGGCSDHWGLMHVSCLENENVGSHFLFWISNAFWPLILHKGYWIHFQEHHWFRVLHALKYDIRLRSFFWS